VIRVALLGSDSTHVEAFARRIVPAEAPFHGVAEICALYGEDRREAELKAATLGIPFVANSAEEAVAGANLAMVVGRFADSHVGHAMTALARGIPTFVDKPFAASGEEARKLVEFAIRHRTPLCSCSPLRFAREVVGLRDLLNGDLDWRMLTVSAPAEASDLGFDPRLQRVLFYGIHGAEVLMELFPTPSRDFVLSKDARSVTATTRRSDGRMLRLELLFDIDEAYGINVTATDGPPPIAISLDGTYYTALLQEVLVRFPSGNGRLDIESAVQAIELLDRMDAVQMQL